MMLLNLPSTSPVLKMVLFASCVASLALNAGPIAVGVGDPGNSNCYPFTCNDSGITSGQSLEYQQVYASSAFPGLTSITALQFPDVVTLGAGTTAGPVLTGNYLITFSITSAAVNALSSTLASNAGIDSATFFNGALDGDFSTPNGLVFTGTPYLYDPTLGNLLIDIIATNQPDAANGTGNGYLDADNTGSVTSRAFNVTGGLNSTGATGLVTVFNPDVATPEPGSLALMGTGLVLILGFRRKLLFR